MATQKTLNPQAAAIAKVEAFSENAHCAVRNLKTMVQAIEDNVSQFRRLASDQPQFIAADGVADRMSFLQRLLVIADDEAGRAEAALEAIETAFFDIPTER